MIPAEWQLRVPEGVDDPTTRALTTLVEERMGGVPVESVLVWRTDTVVESALAHLAELFDVDMVAHGVDQTRALLEQAVDRLLRRGTASAPEETLEALGLAGANIQEHDTIVRRDGTIVRDGTHLHGYDSHWAIFWVFVEAGVGDVELPEVERMVSKNKRLVTHLGAVFGVLDLGSPLETIVSWYRPGLAGVSLATEDGDVLTDEDGHPLILLEAS